ncbi:MAG TPA: hypothetical protein VD931_02805 [Baekduia sp.]|nr:hypothetical protein [Baekduia sp.]
MNARIRLVAIGTAAALTAGAPTAHAGLLDSLLPSLGGTVTNVGSTVGSVPLVGGVVTTVTGTVGGVVTGVEDTLTGTVDGLVGGVLDGATGSGSLLPTDVLDQLLGTVGGALAPGGATGATGAPGVPGTTGSGGFVLINGVPTPTGVVDAAAPDMSVTVASTLRQIHKTGSLRLRVRSSEPGVAAIGGAVRPGTAYRKPKKKKKTARTSAARHSRKVIKFPAAVLAFRKAGELQVTVKLGRVARRNLGASRNARISVATVSADRYRNQASDTIRRTIKR